MGACVRVWFLTSGRKIKNMFAAVDTRDEVTELLFFFFLCTVYGCCYRRWGLTDVERFYRQAHRQSRKLECFTVLG